MRFGLTFVLLILLIGASGAQVLVTIKGRVLDQVTQRPVINALVSIEEAEQHTYTNQQGQFVLVVPAGDHVIRIFRIEFDSSSIVVNCFFPFIYFL